MLRAASISSTIMIDCVASNGRMIDQIDGLGSFWTTGAVILAIDAIRVNSQDDCTMTAVVVHGRSHEY